MTLDLRQHVEIAHPRLRCMDKRINEPCQRLHQERAYPSRDQWVLRLHIHCKTRSNIIDGNGKRIIRSLMT